MEQWVSEFLGMFWKINYESMYELGYLEEENNINIIVEIGFITLTRIILWYYVLRNCIVQNEVSVEWAKKNDNKFISFFQINYY